MMVWHHWLVTRCLSSWPGGSLTISTTSHRYVLPMPRGNAIAGQIVHTGTVELPITHKQRHGLYTMCYEIYVVGKSHIFVT